MGGKIPSERGRYIFRTDYVGAFFVELPRTP
jgi:hypothetical protein